MRPPWLTLQEGDDAETLQTDVMRFLAILGLCLAAIFSLVQSATIETATPTPAISAQDSSSTDKALPSPQPEQLNKSQTPESAAPAHGTSQTKGTDSTPDDTLANTPTDAPLKGFTMSFTSASAMRALIETRALALYANNESDYWQLEDGGFVTSAPPQSYYEMESSTIPARLSELFNAATGTRAQRWGVTLPAATASDIERILSMHRGGDLIIDARGRVSIDAQ